jgi:protein-tyrosine phosphatase
VVEGDGIVRSRQSRLVRLSSVQNMRDLGGLQSSSGLQVRKGVLFRGAVPVDVSEPDLQALIHEYKLRSFVDLRSESECLRDGDLSRLAAVGVNIISAPIENVNRNLGCRPQPSDYLRSYIAILEQTAKLVSTLIHLIVGFPSALPMMYGCSVGKDRTGVVSALILSCLGVSPKSISRDYELSARCLRQSVVHFRGQWERKGLSSSQYAIRLETVSSTMVRLLEYCNVKYGSATSLLESHNVNFATMTAIRRHLLVR